MGEIIEVKDLVKRYRKAKENAVDHISFDVGEGEFFAFLGPNGAGKTTTISILTTTLAKTSGEVRIAGYDLDRQASRVRQSIGVIFQNPSLDQNLTAEENLRFHCVLYGLYPFAPTYGLMREGYKRKVSQLSKVLGIENDLNKPIKSFSGGMKRKLEIIRSLMHNPKVLFLDEPTSGLDPASRKSLWEYLRQVREGERTTIFLTTHYLEEAEEADRVAIIDKGKIVSLGTPEQIKKKLIKSYLLIGSRETRKLESELNKLKTKYTKLNGKYRVDFARPAEVQKLVSKIKTSLNYLNIHNPTLEEAYLDIITKENNASH